MRFNASSDSWSNDVLVEASEPRVAVLWAPVTGAAVSGASLALVAAALICVCHRKRLIDITAPFGGVQRRLLEECEEQSEADSTGAAADTQPDDGGEPQWTVSSDVAAFALKARVVYPINQRYRPLADGASNPSLQEPLKCPAPPSQDSASSLADDWPSQERDDDESSQFVSCDPSSKTHAGHVFRRVQYYPQTPWHSRVSLLSLTLQELQMHTTQLQQHKYRMFLQVLRVLLREKENADVIQEQQRQEVELLLKGVSVAEGAGSDTCSLEEVEKTGREQLERSLQTAVGFAQQLERLGQDLHCRFSSGVSEEVMLSVVSCLRVMEDALVEVQTSILKMLLERFLCWQEVSDCLKEKTSLLQQEAELMLKVTGQSAEQLRTDGRLEKQILSVLETAVNDALKECADEMKRQTEELALSSCQKACARRRRMMKTQSAEYSRVTDTQTDARLMTKASAELQLSQWHQRREFDLQQDSTIIEALCERWTSLCSQCSRCVADLCGEFVMTSITADPAPSVAHSSAPFTGQCESVLKRMKLSVADRIEKEEKLAHTRLQTGREQLRRHRQVWTEDEALTRSCLDHLGQQQRQIVMATVSRHSHVPISRALIEEQQQLLILEFQRILAARCFYLRSVREMKLTVRSDSQDCSVAMGTGPLAEAVIGQNLKHEQLSELEAAADMLQGHAHFLIGHTLVRAARLQISGGSRDRQVKEQLIDAVCESVYVTRDSVSSLIRDYYSRIRNTSQCGAAVDNDTHTQMTACSRALQTQLNNWARKPTSTELQHRVVELKRKCVMEIQKDHQSPVQTHYSHLRDEERSFMCRLASLARVSLSSVKDDFTEAEHHRDRRSADPSEPCSSY